MGQSSSKTGRRGWGQLRKERSGRWHASYIGWDLVRHHAPNTFSGKMYAERWLANERKLYEEGSNEWTSPGQREAEKLAAAMTLEEYAETWLATKDVKYRTRKWYEDQLRLRIIPGLGALPVNQLTQRAVKAWYYSLDPSKPVARGHSYQTLYNISESLITDEYLMRNPCRIKGATATKRKRKPIVPTIEEMELIVNGVELQQFQPLLLIAAWCGLRWGEVTELRHMDFSEECSTLNLWRAVTHRGKCDVDMPKNSEPRAITVPESIRPILMAHMARQTPHPRTLLFPAMQPPVDRPSGCKRTRRSCHLDERLVRDALKAPLAAVGRTGMRIHDFRHFAQQQADRVGTPTEVMKRMGHKTVKASNTYRSVPDDADQALAQRLSTLREAAIANNARNASNEECLTRARELEEA